MIRRTVLFSFVGMIATAQQLVVVTSRPCTFSMGDIQVSLSANEPRTVNATSGIAMCTTKDPIPLTWMTDWKFESGKRMVIESFRANTPAIVSAAFDGKFDVRSDDYVDLAEPKRDDCKPVSNNELPKQTKLQLGDPRVKVCDGELHVSIHTAGGRYWYPIEHFVFSDRFGKVN